jgi:hypothetical protein
MAIFSHDLPDTEEFHGNPVLKRAPWRFYEFTAAGKFVSFVRSSPQMSERDRLVWRASRPTTRNGTSGQIQGARNPSGPRFWQRVRYDRRLSADKRSTSKSEERTVIALTSR